MSSIYVNGRSLDVLQHVVSMLSPATVCVLSLTNKKLHASFKHCYRVLLPQEHNDRRYFLLKLEQDLQEYVLCFACVKLYKWKAIEDKSPRLCPNRAVPPHCLYGHLDIAHHDRRIPRELIDLAHRVLVYGSKYGVSIYHLLEIMQGKETVSRALTMPFVSLVSATWKRSLIISTKIEVRISLRDDQHPLYSLIDENDLGTLSRPPSDRPLRHSRPSTVTLWLGCNLHEGKTRLASASLQATSSQFLVCHQCQSSVRISRRYFGPWVVLGVATSQSFGSAYHSLGYDNFLAGTFKQLSMEETRLDR